VPETRAAVRTLTPYLNERGISVKKMEQIRPSLEDVFVSLTTTHSEPTPDRRLQ